MARRRERAARRYARLSEENAKIPPGASARRISSSTLKRSSCVVMLSHPWKAQSTKSKDPRGNRLRSLASPTSYDTWFSNAAAKRFHLIGSETPCFVGRAIAGLAADPDVAAKNGGLFSSWGLSEEYAFEDVDGRRPHWGTAFAEHLKTHFYDEAKAAYRWEIAPAE